MILWVLPFYPTNITFNINSLLITNPYNTEKMNIIYLGNIFIAHINVAHIVYSSGKFSNYIKCMILGYCSHVT